MFDQPNSERQPDLREMVTVEQYARLVADYENLISTSESGELLEATPNGMRVRDALASALSPHARAAMAQMVLSDD